MKGVIVKGIGGFYYIKAEDKNVYECKARGIFRKDNQKPMIGDRVEVSIENSRENRGNIEKIGERRNVLVRPPVANIDSLVIVAATASPDPNLLLLDKMLVTAELNGIQPILCFNKTDIESCERLKEIYKSTGYPMYEVSAKDKTGIEALLSRLKDKTTAFAGLSGVGKSSILNHIIESELETGEVSERIKRGRHTTRHVELFNLEIGGYVLDTPGFSSFEVDRIKAAELRDYFPEMRGLDDLCRFKGCSHINEPDCAVKERLEAGEISRPRYESYRELYNSLKLIKEWEK